MDYVQNLYALNERLEEYKIRRNSTGGCPRVMEAGWFSLTLSALPSFHFFCIFLVQQNAFMLGKKITQ